MDSKFINRRYKIINNVNMRAFFSLIFLSFACSTLSAQATVVNPSFEDTPSDATVPKGWLPCQSGTTPDILPGFWGEYEEASHGNTYMGLITRENSTYEGIGQRLSQALEAEACYRFSLDLMQGQVYSGYNKPIKLRIWVGESKCDKGQLIYESKLIDNDEWEKHLIEFTTKQKANYIILEAFKSEDQFSYKGNVLLDNMTTIRKCGRV